MRIGIDLGGSHVGVGLIDEDKIVGKVREYNFTNADRKSIESVILSMIPELIRSTLSDNNMKMEEIELIGIASPGTISNGVTVKAGNLNLKNFELVNKLKEIYPSTKIILRNDGKCAALAEKKYGSLKPYDDCIFMNIGTGIGGAVFMQGKLLEPKKYSGFELGHMVVNPVGKECTCGKRGCLEVYSSIKALKNSICETLNIDNDISGQQLREEIIPQKVAKVGKNIGEFILFLRVGLCNYIDIFEPEAICFGGSFSYWDYTDLYKVLMEEINRPNTTFNGDIPKFVVASLHNDAGIVGATIDF